MSGIDDEAAKRLEAERDEVEISPAQPDDASRIDDDNERARLSADGAPHVKPDHSGRMTH
jgi:hypothetical protein